MYDVENLINGQNVASKSGQTSPIFNPATGEQIGVLGLSSAEEINSAVAAAKAALPA